MRYRFLLLFTMFFLVNILPAEAFQAPAAPKYKVRLELFSEGALQPMSAQQWGAKLNERETGFHGVEIRGSSDGEELDVVEVGGNIWSARGMLRKNDTILMPGGKAFRLSEARQMYPYVEEIIEMLVAKKEVEKVTAGNPGGRAALERLPFGLKAGTYEAMYAELEKPVGFSTKDMRRGVFLSRMTGELKHKVEVDRQLAAEIAADREDVITEELQEVSRGTALAYVLRYVGLSLVPAEADAKLVYRFVPAEKVPKEIFPVGHELQEPERDAFPEILEIFNANVDGASLATLLTAVSGRLEVPILYDYNAMARQGIETEKVAVRYKPQRVSYYRLLDETLSQAKLMKEVRVDEAGNVFLWVTTVRR